MERIITALEEIRNINQAYGLPTESIEKLQCEISDAKVCTPIIGKFSSGKSALVNTVLGYSRKILREDITPETAVPAELVYSDEEEVVTIIQNDGRCETISVDDYRRYEADATVVKCVRIQLRNSFLEKVPDVMLVDMPGFESGFEIHNKAIDNYLPQSLAYIIAFPADDMIVRSSVGNILKELCLHDMPLCVVITKCDKKNDEFDETLAKMKENLKRFVGNREIHYCMTSSFEGNAEDVEDFLKEIQEKSQIILSAKYKKMVYAILETTENYFVTTLKSSELSESELNEKEEKIQKELSALESKVSRDKEDFEMEISECVEEIKNDVLMAMEQEENTLVSMAMNEQNINEHLNTVVRNAVTVSVKKRFISKVEKYIKKVSNCINSEAIGDVHISFTFDSDKLNKGIASSVVAVVAGIIVGFPILGIIAGVAMRLMHEKKREEVKQQIRMKLQSEVFPQVLQKIGHGIETEITKQVNLVNTSIEEDLKTQRETLEKSMADVREKLKEEEEQRKNLEIDLNKDLERVKELKADMQ